MSASAPTVISPLSGERFVALTGAHAEKFLNAQLSRDVAADARAPLAAWHDPKGRVLALLRVLRHADRWLLLLHGATPATLIQRLGRFVLRDEVGLRDASGEWRCAAVLGAVDDWLGGLGSALGGEPGDLASVGGGAFVIRVSPAMAYLAAPQPDFSAVESQLPRVHGAAARLAEIREGLPEVTAELAGRFPPQVLNLDRLGAIAFDKGCYPGQEVIARIRHLGRVKRRLFRFSAPLRALPPAGSPLMDTSGSEVGEVVRAAMADDGHTELLAVVAIDAAGDRLVCLREPEVPLTRESLPGETGVTGPRASDEGRGSRRESMPSR